MRSCCGPLLKYKMPLKIYITPIQDAGLPNFKTALNGMDTILRSRRKGIEQLIG